MSNIQIVSDTAHNLPEEISREISMIEVPFAVVVGEQVYKDNELTLAALAALLEQRKGSYPTTAAPPPYEFLKAFKASVNKDGILVVTIGSKVSATYANAYQAVALFREQTGSTMPIEVVDSNGGTMTQGFLLMKAKELLEGGLPLEEVASTLREQAAQANLIFALRETTYLYRSGRAKRIQHLFASVLKYKPIIGLKDGELNLAGRSRGAETKAFDKIASEVARRCGGKIEKLALIGGLGTEEGEERVRKKILDGLDSPPDTVLQTKMCAAMMVHMGPHAVGAAWV